MIIEKAGRETLRYLFAEYQKGPSVPYTINAITDKLGVSAVEVSDYLLMFSWIRERWIFPNNEVCCRITIRGIEEIEPVYVRHKLQQIIGGLGRAGGSESLLEILEYNLPEYPIAVDLIAQLEELSLVKITHPHNNIVIELTPNGWQYYEKGNRTFFTLVAYSVA